MLICSLNHTTGNDGFIKICNVIETQTPISWIYIGNCIASLASNIVEQYKKCVNKLSTVDCFHKKTFRYGPINNSIFCSNQLLLLSYMLDIFFFINYSSQYISKNKQNKYHNANLKIFLPIVIIWKKKRRAARRIRRNGKFL